MSLTHISQYEVYASWEIELKIHTVSIKSQSSRGRRCRSHTVQIFTDNSHRFLWLTGLADCEYFSNKRVFSYFWPIHHPNRVAHTHTQTHTHTHTHTH